MSKAAPRVAPDPTRPHPAPAAAPTAAAPTACASGFDACPTGGASAAEVAAAVSDGRCPLSVLGVGCRGRVCAVGGEGELRRRLLEMGFCGNASVEVVRRSPFGDPTEFRLRGYHLSLRGEDAKHVTIVPDAAR